MSSSDAAFAYTEARLGLGGVLSALWVNHPGRIAAEYMPVQLALAASLGLPVPRTMATHDVVAAREFAAAARGPVVCKTFSSLLLAEAAPRSGSTSRTFRAALDQPALARPDRRDDDPRRPRWLPSGVGRTCEDGGMATAMDPLTGLLTVVAGQAAARFEAANVLVRRSRVVHAVSMSPWMAGVRLPAPACHVGVSGWAIEDLHPTQESVSCLRCLRAAPQTRTTTVASSSGQQLQLPLELAGTLAG